jgi:hypothetical protein
MDHIETIEIKHVFDIDSITKIDDYYTKKPGFVIDLKPCICVIDTNINNLKEFHENILL